MSWLAGLVLWTAAAWAGEFYFEGPVHEARAEAVSSSRAARDAGLDARVVRRYRDGAGWEYLVRVAGFASRTAADETASEVARLLGGEVALYEMESEEAEPALVAGNPEGRSAARASGDPDEDAALLPPSALEPTIAAHGGADGGVARIHGAQAVLFRFDRTLPTGEVVGHTWARQGTSVYAEVTRIEGEVTPSKTLITDAGAWVAVSGGAYTAQDRERTLETITAFAPEGVVPFVLSFAALTDERKELRQMRDEGTRERDGAKVRVLHSDGDQASGPLVLEVDAKTALVRRVDFNDGAMVVQFDDWPSAGGPRGVLLPGTVRTWREGKLVDTVAIREINVAPDLPKGWFEAP